MCSFDLKLYIFAKIFAPTHLFVEYIYGIKYKMVISFDKQLNIIDFYPVLYKNQKVSIDKKTINRVRANFTFLSDYLKGKIIYGINTGLGPMAQYKIDDSNRQELQYNLIRSHCTGMGEPLDEHSVKASMISRLNCFARGYSGINHKVIILLRDLINNNAIPLMPEHGGVGASGDLVQLAHLALVLIGEGKIKYNEKWQATAKVFEELKLSPAEIHIREGLSLINGTSVMTGIAVVNILRARNLLNWMVIASAIINELVESYNDHYSMELNSVKLHHGQKQIARIMSSLLKDSHLISRNDSILYHTDTKDGFFIEKRVQEYYSLRCVPQILGPVYDTLTFAENIVINEINSVSDNPVIDHNNKNVIHGGNFHGDYVSLEMDKLKIAVTKLAMLSERQLNFLLNHKINQILPPFVNLGKLGLNFGMQGAQFTATSSTAECQTLSNPMYIHSIPSNNDNQDIVSMGTNSAQITKRVIDNGYQIITIELMTLMQAIDYLKLKNKLSSFTKNIYEELREIFPKFVNDYSMYEDIKKIKEHIDIKNKYMNIAD